MKTKYPHDIILAFVLVAVPLLLCFGIDFIINLGEKLLAK